MEPDTFVEFVADISLDEAASPESEHVTATHEKPSDPARPMMIYTRPQLLLLQKSPLVQLPADMPPLKDWFGVETDLQGPNKKDSEPATSGRERRFRRDAEDYDLPARPSFRSSLSQPSTMGNFKHQSLRTGDRDREHRERDTDKERERDIRDKEGQERLRSLSDKYDRDRLASPAGPTGLRGKERDLAPHLAAGSSRLGAAPSGTTTSRRSELRETPKKKANETEDWRRGAESPRPGREDRTDTARRDRSKPRDSSRSIRDADKDDKDGDDESKKWREDGKRDRRLPAREKGAATSEEYQDRRWTVVEDRDGRSKRNSGRDRRTGAADEPKEKEERKEKEKEPAWMEAYVPGGPGAGILGAKVGDELDGIQAFKKGMKEKEDKSRGIVADEKSKPAEKGLDEIQMFKLMMEKEKAKKTEPQEASPSIPAHRPTAALADSVALKMGEHGPSDSFSSAIPFSTPSDPLASNSEASRSLLSLLTSSSSNGPSVPAAAPPPPPQGSRFFPKPLAADNAIAAPVSRVVDLTSAPTPPLPSVPFNPSQGSRLLAFGSRGSSGVATPPISKPQTPTNAPPTHGSNSFTSESGFNQGALIAEGMRRQQGFSPFEEQNRPSNGADHYFEGGRRNLLPGGDRNAFTVTPHDQQNELGSNSFEVNSSGQGYGPGKGSRFAKFFGDRGEQPPVQSIGVGAPKAQAPPGFGGSPPANQRGEMASYGAGGGVPGESRGMEDLFAMLNNSAQGQRGNAQSLGHALPQYGQERQGLTIHQQQLLAQHQHQLQQRQQQAQQMHSPNRSLEALYESRLDDRNFQADGLVPGLRSAPPPPRPRENSNFVHDPMEETMHYNNQRRGMDYGGGPSMYVQQQQGRNQGISLQQGHYRGPSPIQSQSALLAAAQAQQRLPPGLANLGGRPPHDSGFMGAPMGMQQQQQQQQLFQNFQGGGGFSGGGQMRGPSGSTQLQNQLSHNSMGGNMGHSNMDVRTANQAQLMALGGNGSMDLRARGYGPQQGLSQGGGGHQQGQGLPTMDFQRQLMRQQQQQQQQQYLQQQNHMSSGIHQQGMQHHQSGHGMSDNQSHDLMALLMAGHRE